MARQLRESTLRARTLRSHSKPKASRPRKRDSPSVDSNRPPRRSKMVEVKSPLQNTTEDRHDSDMDLASCQSKPLEDTNRSHDRTTDKQGASDDKAEEARKRKEWYANRQRELEEEARQRSEKWHARKKALEESDEWKVPTVSLHSKEEQKRWRESAAWAISTSPGFFQGQYHGEFESFRGETVAPFVNAGVGESGSLGWESLSAQTRDRITRWVSETTAKDYLESGYHDILLEAWVWRILFDNLLSPECTDKWSSQPWVDYDKTRQGFQARVAHRDNTFTVTFHDWRYTSVRMIYALHGTHSEPARLEKIFKEELGDFTKKCGVDIEEIGQSLTFLVESFITLDLRLLLGGSHTIWEMHDPETSKLFDFPFRNDKNSMKIHENMGHLLDDGQNVDFIVRPRLRQWGSIGPDHRWFPRAHECDWEGYNYDSEFVHDDPMAIASRTGEFRDVESEDEVDEEVDEADKKVDEKQPQREPERAGAV